jgi:hypothetical protein
MNGVLSTEVKRENAILVFKQDGGCNPDDSKHYYVTSFKPTAVSQYRYCYSTLYLGGNVVKGD